MNRRFSLGFSLDYFCLNIKNGIGMILMLLICMVSCGLVFFVTGDIQFSSDVCDDILKEGSEETFIISMDYASESEATQDISESCKSAGIENIECIGYMEDQALAFSDDAYFQSLFSQQTSLYEKGGKENSGRLICVYLESSLKDFYDLDFKEGSLPDEIDDDVWYAVLGSKYQDIPIGTEFTATDYYGNERTVVVCGSLKAGSYLLESDSIYGDIKSVDDEILIFSNAPVQTSRSVCYFTVKDIDKLEETKAQLQALFLQSNITTYITSIADIFDSETASNKIILDYLYEIAVMLVIVSVIIILCTQSVSLLSSRRNIGIWYANGADVGDVITILVLNVLYEIIITGVLAYSVAYALIHYIYMETGEIQKSIMVLNQMVLPKCALMLVLINAVSLILPLIIIMRDKPAILIRQYSN